MLAVVLCMNYTLISPFHADVLSCKLMPALSGNELNFNFASLFVELGKVCLQAFRQNNLSGRNR
jgi:hypothetical protein